MQSALLLSVDGSINPLVLLPHIIRYSAYLKNTMVKIKRISIKELSILLKKNKKI